jgi:glutaredoxin 3
VSEGESEVRIEVFSAGCQLCHEKLRRVRKLAGPGAAVRVIDMHSEKGAALAEHYGVTHVPAVVVAGRLIEGDCSEDDPSEKGGKK